VFWKLVDLCLGLLSNRIRAVDINRVWFDQNKFCKSRRWWGWVLILIGNPVLACRQVPVSVLFTSQWIRWEGKIKQVCNGETIPAGHVLVCDQITGVSLTDWLIESCEMKDRRLEVLKLAVSGLQQFHRLEVDDGRGQRSLLSHGDATLNNALYDAEDRSVQWIDFDLRHWLNVSAPQRHADDLRAFLFSAVRHLPDDEIRGFLSAMRQQYDAPLVWSCLRSQLSSRWFQFDVFHQAQIERGRDATDSAQDHSPRFAMLKSLICD